MKQLYPTVSILFVWSLLTLTGCTATSETSTPLTYMKPEPIVSETSATLDSATFGNGCFWCTEAVFQQLKGVDTVVSGYSGGKLKNPTYKEVCSGLSGHAEVLRIYFNPKVIDFTTLLEVFWNTHDPTTPNRQGNDVGTQYRSVVFYHNDQQRILAEAYKKQLDSSGVFKAPIVTEISPLINFYAAEDYHQNYFNENGSQPYCQIIIRPKVEKFKKSYSTLLKQP